MIPVLPNEIVERIIECAALQDLISEIFHTYEICVLTNLCLVSKRFYALCAPLLYRDIIISMALPLQELLPELLPLLSREQRRKLKDSAPGEHDVLLIDQERVVDPLWVRKLTIVGDFPEAEATTDYTLHWQYIDEFVQDMENLHWETRCHNPRLAQRLSKLQRLSHLTCSSMDCLASLSLEPSLVPLRSISVDCGLVEDHLPESLLNLFQISSKSLRMLHLSFTNTSLHMIDSTMSKIFDKFSSTELLLPGLEDLRLTVYGKDTIRILTKMIDFSRLKYLQLVKLEEDGELPQALGQLSLGGLQRLSACLVPSSVIDVLNRCRNLQEIHIVYQDNDPQKVTNPTWGVLEAVLKHGNTLRQLSLNGTFCRYASLNADGFAKIAGGCPKLEDLKVNPDFSDWSRIVVEIAKFRLLKHICLDTVFGSPISPFVIKGDQVLICHEEPWWDEVDEANKANDGRRPESQFSELDKAIGQLLEASVNHAVSIHNTTHDPRNNSNITWRDYSKLRFVRISAQGINPYNYFEFLSQGYLLREGSPVRESEEQYTSYHGTLWIAPVGHLYSYNSPYTSISVEVAEPNPRYARILKIKAPAVVSGWDTAFKAASNATQGMVGDFTRME